MARGLPAWRDDLGSADSRDFHSPRRWIPPLNPIDRLGQHVVVAFAGATHRGLDASRGQTFALADGDVLQAAAPVVAKSPSRSTRRIWRLLKRIEQGVSVCVELLALQPTMRRSKTSMTKAAYAKLCLAGTLVKFATLS